MNKTKDKNKKVLSPWWKGFLTSILGTTISIALTFGTTALVNSKKKADTFTIRAIHHVAHPIYSGKIVRTATLEGTWTIEGDSIIAIFNPSTCKLSADDSGISYAKEMRDSIRRFVDLWLVGEKQLHDL